MNFIFNHFINLLLLNKISQIGIKAGLNINIAKTKFMVFSRQPHGSPSLHLYGRQVGRVESFKYQGCIINDQLNPYNEIKSRIESACFTFNKMRSFFCDDNLNLKLRQKMVKCYVWPILLYGVEAWTLKVTPMNRLEAFEM